MATKKHKVDQEEDLLSAPNHDIDPQCLNSSAAATAGGPVAPPPDVMEDDEADEEEEDVGKLLEPHLMCGSFYHFFKGLYHLPYGFLSGKPTKTGRPSLLPELVSNLGCRRHRLSPPPSVTPEQTEE